MSPVSHKLLEAIHAREDRPIVSLVVDHPKSSLAPSGAKVTIRLSLTRDAKHEAYYYPMRVEVPDETEDVAPAEVLELTRKWLQSTWHVHQNALNAILETQDHERKR